MSGLSRRFAAVMGLLALVPVLFLSWRLAQVSRRGVQDAVLELHVKLAEKSAERVDGWIASADGRVQVALTALQARMDWEDKQALLKRLVEGGTGVASISLSRRGGGVLLGAFNPDLCDGPVAAGAKAGEVTRGKSGPLLVLRYPFGADVTALAAVPLEEIARQVAEDRVGGTGFGVLVGADGRPLSAPEGRDLSGSESWAITRAALAGRAVGSSEFADAGGRFYVGAYAPVPRFGGAVLVLQARDEAYAAAAAARRAAAAAIAVVVVGSLLAAGLLARWLTAPLLQITRAAEAVSRGDFEARVRVTTGDELQGLAETFNAMSDRLRQYSLLQVDRVIAEQRKTEAILFSIAEGILMADRDGLVRLANRRAREILGLPDRADLEGRPLAEALPPGELRQAVLEAAARPGHFREVDLSSGAERRFVRVRASPVVAPGRDTELGTVYALRDVTLERELEKMKEDFLHYITHDLRNPLGSAIGFLDVLLKGTAGPLTPDQGAIVSSIRRSSTRLMGLINNILDIAKMDSGRMRLQLRETAPAAAAARAADILQQLAKAKDVSILVEGGDGLTAQADADMLERVFANLIGNAIKYTPEGGRVTVRVEDRGDELLCSVEDTGEGIPADALTRIFEKFEQAHGSRRGGTGLGLTIARFFVEAHLGRIWAESEVGRGSRFLFTVPKGLSAGPDGSARAAAAA